MAKTAFHDDGPFGRFQSLLSRLARVPKREIDEQQRKEDRHPSEPSKPRQIATIPERKRTR